MGANDLLSLFGIESEEHEAKLTILSMGLGQDSVTILLKLIFDVTFRKTYAPNDLLILFADTGNEHPETYRYHHDVVVPLCKQYNIEYIAITSDMGYHGNHWESLTAQWDHGTPTIGSVGYPKTCTHRLKLQPQYNFVETWISKKYRLPKGRKRGYVSFASYYGKIKWLIGIAKGEENRIADASAETALWKRKAVEVVYPLIEIGYNRSACQQYIRSMGFPLPLPSNCMFCPYAGSNHIELLWLYRTYPDRFLEWVEYEQKKLDAHKHVKRNLGVTARIHKQGERAGEPFTLMDMLDEALEKYGDMTLEDLQDYKWSHGHCVASKY